MVVWVVRGGGEKPSPVARSEAHEHSPPDLSDCTRLEVTYVPSTIRRLFPGATRQLLNEEEIAYLTSLQQIAVEDRDAIKALADKLATATYSYIGMGSDYLAVPLLARVTGYRDRRKAASFAVMHGYIVTEDGRWFNCGHTGFDPFRLAPELRPYTVRQYCATHMWGLSGCFHRLADRTGEYPSAEEWCDALMAHSVDLGRPRSSAASDFLCPGAGEGNCHFAMNPACTPESAPDCVLLFETEAGWNKHGGPELFSFEHHEPRGGHALLNGKGIKFIRTEDELHALRWK
jgi:hypothetical protein